MTLDEEQRRREFETAFNEGEPDGAPAAGGGMELPADAVEAAQEDGTAPAGADTTAATAPADEERAGDAPAGEGPVEGALADAADNAGGESTVDGTVVDTSVSATTPGEEDTSTPPMDVDTTSAAPGDAESDLPNDGDGEDEPTDPKDIQRKKSWEGRLKADERALAAQRAELEAFAAKLAAKEGAPASGGNVDDAAAIALDGVAEQTEGSNPEMSAEATDVAGQLARGEISADEAIKTLTADFGDGFTKMMTAIIDARVAEKTGAVTSRMDEIGTQVKALGADRDAVIEHIENDRLRVHFEKLAAAKPNFAEINADPAFDAFVQEKGADAQAVRTSGSVQDIVALIKEFEESRGKEMPAETVAAETPTETVDESEIEAATAVRGGGMELPNEPRGADDFEGTWNDTPDVPTRRRA